MVKMHNKCKSAKKSGMLGKLITKIVKKCSSADGGSTLDSIRSQTTTDKRYVLSLITKTGQD